MLLHYHPGFHPELAYLCKRLRYILGGDHPSQTTHQTMSSTFKGGVRSKIEAGWYFTDDSFRPEGRRSKSPIYAKQFQF